MHKNYFRKNKGLFFSLVFLSASLFFSGIVYASEKSLEFKIKAGYLYNFTKFVSWPETSSKTFNLCILGKDPFGSIIDPIEKRSVKNKPIRIFRLDSVKDIHSCQMVYFADFLETGNIPKLDSLGILTIRSFKQTLTVSDSRQFIRQGGMVAFHLKGGKVKLLIDPQSINKSGLTVSAKLLEVAEIVEGEGND